MRNTDFDVPRPKPASLLIPVAAIAIAAALLLLPDSRPTEEVRWTSGSVELAGTLYLPRGEGPHPAAVFVPGWGDWTRSEKLFREHAERLADDGLAMLIYDKRGCGASTGDWRRARLVDLAEDALGGARLLREDPRIRPAGVGLFGTSQGGAIAVLAASRSPEIAFVATLSLSTRSPAEHDAFIVGATLRRKGYSDEQAAAAVDLHRRIASAYRTGHGWEEARSAFEALREEPWFPDSGIELHAVDSPPARAYRDLPMDFDLVPMLEELEIPLFAAQGEEDWLVPGPREIEVLESIRRERERDFTIVLIPEVGHVLRERAGWPVSRWTWPESYWTALDDWLDVTVRRP